MYGKESKVVFHALMIILIETHCCCSVIISKNSWMTAFMTDFLLSDPSVECLTKGTAGNMLLQER